MVTIVTFINSKRSCYSSEGECFVLHEIVEQRSERLGELSVEPRIEQYY